LKKADLRLANLKSADLRGADLSGADLTQAVQLNETIYDAATKWPEITKLPEGFNPS